mmetsp:Transcript_25269/g.38907  ORF Transcript_25269/g.38907 Transcript_25269/m.38907 type:complete len:202 (+) Transcript_25269:183-788(+)|eukprot:CAMPEP_0195299920 /NCGR_PEP_ID=MMETSP0707-20130614/26427_1 /TAXON_ID=33640 /ORGANISM="Asterionellopsis glacialis, Strain CCMP134" /LENGTH=201 /DNA_ID=CAMNT_0040362449 /DNA_START=69 /DNA_END=674 /DNA_ORIENTATION=-
MTRQQNDVLRHYKGQDDYNILEVEGGKLYHPPSSLKPGLVSSACWRGYQCFYEVSSASGELMLSALSIQTEDNEYPPIEGIRPTFGYLVPTYVGLRLPMSHFTGRILIVKDLLPRMIGSSDRSDWDATYYKCALEIRVNQGRVSETIDRSEEVASRRERNLRRNDGEEYHPYSWTWERYCEGIRDRAQHPEMYPESDPDDL